MSLPALKSATTSHQKVQASRTKRCNSFKRVAPQASLSKCKTRLIEASRDHPHSHGRIGPEAKHYDSVLLWARIRLAMNRPFGNEDKVPWMRLHDILPAYPRFNPDETRQHIDGRAIVTMMVPSWEYPDGRSDIARPLVARPNGLFACHSRCLSGLARAIGQPTQWPNEA